MISGKDKIFHRLDCYGFQPSILHPLPYFLHIWSSLSSSSAVVMSFISYLPTIKSQLVKLPWLNICEVDLTRPWRGWCWWCDQLSGGCRCVHGYTSRPLAQSPCTPHQHQEERNNSGDGLVLFGSPSQYQTFEWCSEVRETWALYYFR